MSEVIENLRSDIAKLAKAEKVDSRVLRDKCSRLLAEGLSLGLVMKDDIAIIKALTTIFGWGGKKTGGSKKVSPAIEKQLLRLAE